MNKKALLYKLGLTCSRHSVLILVICLAVTAVFAFFAMQLDINLGMLTLLDQSDPEVALVNYANDNFGGMDYTFIAVTADTPYDAKRFSDELADAFRKSDMVDRVIHKLDTDTMLKYGFLFMESSQIDDFADMLEQNQDDFVAMFRDVRAAPFLTQFNRMLEREIIEKDEIGDPEDAMNRLTSFDNFLTTVDAYLDHGYNLGPYKLKKSLRDLFIQSASEDETSIKDEYVLSKDGRKVLLLLMPSEPGDDMIFTAQIMDFLEGTVHKIAPNYPGARVDIAGNIAVMRDEYFAIIRDTKLSTAVTSVLVLFIFFFFFRKLSDLGMIALCLTAGIFWTYAVTYFYIGFLGITTAFFSAILLGLGIDFAIHIIARYEEYRQKQLPVDEAIALALSGAGPGIITGGLTTASAFYVLLVCRFKGISQLGFVAGTGILSMVIIMFTFLPAMLSLRDRNKKPGVGYRKMKELPIFAKLAGVMVRHRIPAIVLIVCFTIATAMAATHIRFNYDFRSLEPRNGKAVEANNLLESEFGKSIDYSLAFAKNVDESRALREQIETKPSFVDVQDISKYIPENQEEKGKQIRKLLPLLAPINVEIKPQSDQTMLPAGAQALSHAFLESRRMVLAIKQLAIIGGNFDIEDKSTVVMKKAQDLADKLRTRPARFEKTGAYFEQTLGNELAYLIDNLKVAAKGEPLTIEKLPKVVRENFIGKDGQLIVYAYPDGYVWVRDKLINIRDDMRSITPRSTSIGIVFLELVNKMKQDFRFAIWLSLGMVFLLVYLDFRKLPTALMALIPLVLGTIWMIGTMVFLGLTFNLINVAVVPLIIGIGIDNGVHIIHRYRSEPTDKIRQAVKHTGRAIFLSSITTMAGFGSLGLASYVAIATLGWVLVIGVIYCFFTSVVVLPIILSIAEKRVGKI